MRREQNYHPQGSPESASYRFHEAKIIKKAEKRRATGDEATEGEREQRTREHGTGNMGTWELQISYSELRIPNCELVIPNSAEQLPTHCITGSTFPEHSPKPTRTLSFIA